MNILIPMAGRGQRFAESGRYSLPKPLIDVNGKPMIRRVLENLGLMGKYIFLIRKDMRYQIEPILKGWQDDCVIIDVEGHTEGAACTCLLAKKYIDNDEHLLVANCDQIMNWDREAFLGIVDDADGYIFTFTSDSPKNSYVQVDCNGKVTHVAEKVVISDIATTGVYYWREGKYMVDACEKMIAKNIRCNNEFYLCPCYNENILDGLVIKTIPVAEHWPIGTPDDLEKYCENV